MSIPTADTCARQAPSGLLLDAALSLAQTQLVGQLADETSVDGRMMGTLGFSGALLAADLAARSVLGAFWWTPVVVLSVAASCCLGPMLELGVDLGRGTDLGPNANALYRAYGGQRSTAPAEQLLSDLDIALSSNARRLRAKQRALRVAVLALAVGFPVSAAFIGLS
jgi:hypothetical protein